MSPEQGPLPDPTVRRYTAGMKFALFMLFFADTYGLGLLLATPIQVMRGQSPGASIALGVCGIGLVTWARRR